VATTGSVGTSRRHRRRSRWRAVLLLALIAVLAWYLVACARRIPGEMPVSAIAHRGGSAGTGIPEGTLAAFEAAIAAGADGLEFDVRVTSDGALVVLHDATVDRTTDGHGPIAAMTLEQVRALDAGGGATIPTVQEVVDSAKPSGTLLMPEIKDGPLHPEAPGALVQILAAAGSLDRTIVQAFEPETLDALHRLEPRVATCLLRGFGQFDATTVPTGTGNLCPMGEMVLIDPDMIRRAHAAGLRVFAWWGALETTATDRILEAYGVDGLIVDDLGPLLNAR
jgi:glycerophosphoryl diester phosphodiesterase